MKNFTAIYSTKAIKNIEYAFKAKDKFAAYSFVQDKFDMKNITNLKIVEG